MHWGERRYQNEDGSLTPEGREHYGVGESRSDSGFQSYVFNTKISELRTQKEEILKEVHALLEDDMDRAASYMLRKVDAIDDQIRKWESYF